MEQLAIIPWKQHDIAHELSGCIACLEYSGIQVYAMHRGQGYGVLWAENSASELLWNAGFLAAPLTHPRSAKLGHRPAQVTTSPATTVAE